MSILDQRLQQVLSLIPEGSILLDIGTDHCKLPAEGLLCGRLQKAYAADIRQGPLNAARKQLAALGLEGQIPLFLSDGLAKIPPAVLAEVTAVSVAGMGGEVIQMIMEKAPAAPPLWVLQPMSAVYELLEFLAAAGWRIKAAALAQDGDKFYRAYAVEPGAAPYPAELFEMHRGDPLFLPYLQREEQRILTALEGLSRARQPEPARIAAAELLLQKIRKAML